MSSTATDQNGTVQKHRACDECRTRKLACTKESDGCSRCKRENIPCHYSPQKPMGRPRKRPRDESDERPLAAAPPTKTTMMELPPDTEDPGMEFINLLLGDDFNFSPPAQTQTTMETLDAPENGRSPPWTYTSFGDVNFDSVPADHMPSFSTSNIDPALFITPASLDPPPAEQVPALSPNSNTASSPESSSTSPAVATPSEPTCGCTASLYTALNSMQSLPTEVEPAIRQARLAAKVAYEVVNCNSCSFKLDAPPPHITGSATFMRNFQTLMLLATLIPTIVHGYERILNVVDEEMNRAVAERRKVIFKLHGLGGIWGALSDDDLCGATRAFGYREMEPVMWRLTVRALLKVDVYGISGSCGRNDVNAAGADPIHIGLKDIVLLMENKSKARHALFDTMVAAGVWQQPNCGYLNVNKPGEAPTCQRIISIARTSVEQLVIA
ncbi:hypothetical protein F5Y19DRAFT_13153 [Xylariaceae sp. FL1651]|nr:hypothetical protein F5Y19DRAFT_13153 [Xylariaceae sp. FL1651]